MTSSTYCELVLRAGAEKLSLPVRRLEIPKEHGERPRVRPGDVFEATLRRGEAASLLRLRLEGEEKMRLLPEQREWTIQLTEHLREEYGFAELTVEEASAGEPESWSPVVSLTLAVEAHPDFRKLHEALVAELEEVHLGLARDIASSTWHRGGAGGEVRLLSPEDELLKLTEVHRRLEGALEAIAGQPSRSLRRHVVRARWRSGDAISSRAAVRLAAAGEIGRDRQGVILAPRVALLEKAELTADIEEHRHLRSGLLRLAERAAALARHCRRAASLLEEEAGRWSEEVFQQKTRPRREALGRLEEEAERLERKLRGLLGRLPFLAAAGAPRTRLAPTPIFLGRPAYFDAFRALVEARRQAGGRFDAEGLRVRFRNLATLYEYWLFVRVVGLLRQALGPPEGSGAFSLIDEIYRPELAPGQAFRFRLPLGGAVTAAYEPDFPPPRRAAAGGFCAALVSAPLRPDVVVALEAPRRPPVLLLLDAKSGARFPRSDERLRERLQKCADYLWLIHDPRTGHQPARQLFLVHRALDAAPFTSLPKDLEGVPPPDVRVVGAIPAAPGSTDHLRAVLERFVETYRDAGG